MIWLFAIPIMLAVIFGIAARIVISCCAPSLRPRGYTPLVEPAPDAFPLRSNVISLNAPPSWESGDVPGLLNRPLNHNLSTIVSKSGNPPLAEGEPDNPFALDRGLLGLNLVGRYYPDTNIWELAPYVKQEHEATAGDGEVFYE